MVGGVVGAWGKRGGVVDWFCGEVVVVVGWVVGGEGRVGNGVGAIFVFGGSGGEEGEVGSGFVVWGSCEL